MRDSARVAATIELLETCIASWGSKSPLPADIAMHHYFKQRRFMGSKDRGNVAELIYFIIRNYGLLNWWCEENNQSGARALTIGALVLQKHYTLADLYEAMDGDKFSAARLSQGEINFAKAIAGKPLIHRDMPDHVRYNFPEWMLGELKTSLGPEWKKEMAALSEEATVDLRTNTLLTTREALLDALKKEKYDAEPTTLSPLGVRLKKRSPVFTSETFKKGWFEMQDEGSQLVSLLLPVKPGDKVIDFCAGAGGKTLALAAQMKNKGRILAWDTSKRRLEQMRPRLSRAKVDNVQLHVITSEHDAFIKRHKDSADGVLVDAPCSGCGTWRRNPDLKWRFGPKDLQDIQAIQQRVLDSAARLVKKNGHLLYITCSLLQSENESQIEQFVKDHEKFRVVSAEKIWSNLPQQTVKQGSSFRLTPHQDGTDGFFASLLQRCE